MSAVQHWETEGHKISLDTVKGGKYDSEGLQYMKNTF